MVYVRFISIALCLACVPGIAVASYEDARILYDWGDLGPYTEGPRVLGESDTPLPVGTKVEGYVVQLGGETFLATPGEDLKKITLPADVGLDDLKGKYVAGEVASFDRGVSTLGVAVPAPAPTGDSVSADQTASQQDASQIDLGDGGVASDSRFLSFFDRTGEQLRRTFIFDGVRRAQYDAGVARERLAEVKQLLGENNIEAATIAAEAYHASITRFQNVAENLDASKQQEIESLNKEIAGHAAILSGELVTSVSEEFRERLAPVTQATGQALAVLADKKGAPPLTSEMIDRIQAAASLGTLPKGVAVALFASKNRAEALAGIETQVQNGFLSGPDADYLRFDAVRTNYKSSFERAHEVSKLDFIRKTGEELKKLQGDPALKNQLADFGKTFQPGQEPPEELRRLWAASVHGEAAQMTFRSDKLSPDQLKDPELKKLYDNVRQQLAPTQGDVEGVAGQQSGSPRFLPQFAHVLRLAGSGTREDVSQERREGFGGCASAEDCVNKAKEFQGKYTTPEARREAFGAEFRQLEQRQFGRERPQGDPFPGIQPGTFQRDASRRQEFQPQPGEQRERPAGQSNFWTAPHPNPRDIEFREDSRPIPDQPPSNAPAPREEQREEFRPPENSVSSEGSGSEPNNPPPPPPSSDDGGGGGGNPPPQ